MEHDVGVRSENSGGTYDLYTINFRFQVSRRPWRVNEVIKHVFPIATHIEETIPFPEVQTNGLISNAVEDPSLPPPPPPKDVTRNRLSIFLEGDLDVCPKPSHAHHRYTFPILVEPGLSDPPNPSTGRRTRSRWAKRDGSRHSKTAPSPSKPGATPKKRFTFPGIIRDPEESKKACTPPQVRRLRKSALLDPSPVRAVVKALKAIFRLKKSPRADGPPST